MDRIEFATLQSRLGEVTVFVTGKGVSRVVLGRDEFDRYVESRSFRAHRDGGGEAFRAASEIEQYFSGQRTGFSCRVDISAGTEFQQRVWRELMKIPFGEVATYGEIAGRLGSGRASRAVGGAVGANPVPIIIPCHRVVARGRGGSIRLGGFVYGGGVKSWLLGIEGVRLA